MTAVVVAAAAGALAVGGCGGGGSGGGGAGGGGGGGGATPAAISGRQVFIQACAACHSLTGHNTARQQGGDLLHFHATRRQTLQLTAEMPVLHHRLTQAQLAAVVDYIMAVERRG